MELKQVFEKAENGTLTWEQFQEAAKGAKFVDLTEGNYVSKNKYDDEIAAKTKEIETLNGTISTRDTDLENLKKQLEDAGADATKIQELTDSLTTLQTKYDGDMKSYKEQLKKQAYEFAVKEFTNTQKFTSSAAKRDFERSLLAKELKMDKGSILGADDFVKSYKADNADAFVTEPETPPEPAGNPENIPHFVHPTDPAGSSGAADPTGGFHFNFTGVRPMPTPSN